MFDQFYNVRHLVSPFNDVLTLEEVQKTLKLMREKGTIDEQLLPRFAMFEQNLSGVLERKLLENSSEGDQESYLSILRDLERKLLTEEAKRNNLTNRLVILEERLGEKDNVIHKLQK